MDPSPCNPAPSNEAMTWIQGSPTAQDTNDVVDFEDPPGVSGDGSPSGGPYPANGVAVLDNSPTPSSAYKETCTLPSSQHALCTAVLNSFIASYGNG